MDPQVQSQTERIIPPAEQSKTPETVRAEALEAAAEQPEAAKALVEKTAADAVIEVKDFTDRFADLGPEVHAKADAVEAEIRARAAQAEAQIAEVIEPPKSPAAVAAALLQRAPVGVRKMHAEHNADIAAADAGFSEAHAEMKQEEQKAEERKVIAEADAAFTAAHDVATAEADLTAMHAQAEAGSAVGVSQEVKVMPTISIGEVPSKLARRIKPEDLAAVTARKQISIGGTQGAEVSSEGVKGIAVESAEAHNEAPEISAQEATPDEVREIGEALAAEAEGQEARVEQALESVEAKSAREVLQYLEGRIDQSIAERTAELNGLYAKKDRTPAEQARIDQLEFENGVDRKRKDLRKEQIAYTFIKQRAEEVGAKLATLQEQFDRATDPAEKAKLQAELATLGKESEDLGTQLAQKKEIMTNLRDTMEKLAELALRSKKDQGGEKAQQAETKKSSATDSFSGGMIDRSLSGGVQHIPTGKEGQPSFLEKLVDYAAMPIEKWFDFAFDPEGSSQRTIQFLNQWAKELGEAKKKPKK